MKTSFVTPEGHKAIKTGIDFMIFILIFNFLLYDAIHDFSVLLVFGSNPADIYKF